MHAAQKLLLLLSFGALPLLNACVDSWPRRGRQSERKPAWVTRKCHRKIRKKGCGRSRIARYCAASCNICNPLWSLPVRVPITSACGCTIYQGVTPQDSRACVKNEYFNGRPAVICKSLNGEICPSDMMPCPFPPPSPPPPSPPVLPPPTPPGNRPGRS